MQRLEEKGACLVFGSHNLYEIAKSLHQTRDGTKARTSLNTRWKASWRSKQILLRTSSKKLYAAQVLAKDEQRDLALLSTNAHSCNPLELEDSGQARVGQEVFAIGPPLGLSGTVTRGIVSAIRTTSTGIHYIQLDATINPGNSGGPLLAHSGRVLGINTFKLKGFEGLNFAVLSSEARSSFGHLLR